MKKETARASAMVRASGLKKAPTTPVSRANGRRMTVVDRLEPTSAGRICRVPFSAGSPSEPGRWWRSMFSMTTIASSAIRPSAAAIPERVMRLTVCPVAPSASPTTATVAGRAATAMAVSRKLRRKTRSTRAASRTPIKIASRVPPTEFDTKRA